MSALNPEKTKSTDIKSKRPSFGTPPPPSFLVQEVWGHITLLGVKKCFPPSFFPSAGGLGPYNPPGGLHGPIEPKWGHIALHGGLYSPILAPGRAAWPHFGDGAMLPSFTTHDLKHCWNSL